MSKKRIIPPEKDKRIRITEEIRQNVLSNKNGYSIYKMAKVNGISRSSVRNILNPERLEEQKEKFKKKEKPNGPRTDQQKEKKALYQKRYRDRVKLLNQGKL